MNVLPVRPHLVQNSEQRRSYFDYLEKLGFSWACISYCALSRRQLRGEYKGIYGGFATQAREEGYTACIRIHVSLGAEDAIGISEAQRDTDDNPVTAQGGFFVSMASDAWVAHVKELLDFFIGEIGYQCVIFEGLDFQCDVPGPSDPLSARFALLHPGMQYPPPRSETPEYLMLQHEKALTVMQFCAQLAMHAKSRGACLVGIVPQSFIPADGHAPSSGCEAALLARIPEVDFVASGLSPEELLNVGAQTLDEMQHSPLLFYTEAMALASGKGTIVLGGRSSCRGDIPAEKKMSDVYLRDCMNAALAGDSCGIMVEWNGEDSPSEDCRDVLADEAVCSGRLGQPKAPVAFVFSYCGTRHVEPHSCMDVFRAYWSLAKPMAFSERIPMLTFHAETLRDDLAAHPEVQLLVFDDHFPLNVEQMLAIRDWWQGTHRRAAIAFGVGQGYAADVNAPGLQPSASAYPGMFELIGLKHEEDDVVLFDHPVALKDVSRVRRSAFLGSDPPERISAIAGVKRVFGSRANILYEAELDGLRVPVVAEWRDRMTLAVFCGFGLSPETSDMAVKAVRYALSEIDAPPPIVDSCTDGIVWSVNRNDYVVISNLSDTQGSAVGRPGRANFWDLREHGMLPDGDPLITVDPHSFRAFRVVGRRSKFLDVVGCPCLRSLTDGTGRAEIDLVAGKTTAFVLKNSPREIYVDGRPSTITQKIVDGVYHVTLQQCPPGECRISLRW